MTKREYGWFWMMLNLIKALTVARSDITYEKGHPKVAFELGVAEQENSLIENPANLLCNMGMLI